MCVYKGMCEKHCTLFNFYLLVPPSDVTLSTGVIADGAPTIVECIVSSVYEGKDVTEFRLKVGNSYLSSGTKTESSGSATGTYKVTYTIYEVFTFKSYQSQEIQCEVTWMNDTSVATTKTSAIQTLDIYCKSTFLYVSIGIFVNGSQYQFNPVFSEVRPSVC